MATRATPALSKEQKALISLGRAAEWFVVADREAREARRQRNERSLPCQRSHPDEIPCFRVGIDRVWNDEDLEFLEQDPLPRGKWCKNCRYTAPLHGAAWWAYHHRRSARAAMTAAYRRLVRLREAGSRS